ncbi:MAG TPA: PEP-CTERM sorting domain-containing protein [Lacipirellulaceae bacterium]|jgi:hypothetical protein|nr:PEP-CTERM sorting domain-containing protein [Lacipirellulaceae bacterium]
MSQHTIRLLIASLAVITATTANAVTKTLQTNFFQDASPVASPWFNVGVNGSPASFTSSNDINAAPDSKSIIFKAANGPIQAGTVSSTTVNGNFTITGTSTAAGNWTDNNGIPTGIIVKFNTQITFSVGAGSPADSYLTLSSTPDNGLGIAQGINNSGQLDAGEVLDISAVSITNLNFSGSVAGYTVSNGSVGNFAPYALRSAGNTNTDGLNENSEYAGIYTVPPDPSGKPTIGFGGATGTTTGDNTPGDGTLAGHLSIENGFGSKPINGHTNQFTGPTSDWEFKMLTGSMALKGIAYQYDVSYNISPASTGPLTGDFDGNGVVDENDYVLWRHGDTRADANGDTLVDQTDYDIWRANFGNTNGGPGAGSSLGSAAVPEPTSIGLMLVGLLMACSLRNTASRV